MWHLWQGVPRCCHLRQTSAAPHRREAFQVSLAEYEIWRGGTARGGGWVVDGEQGKEKV